MSLVFESALPPDAPDRLRADVACFIGFVARRAQRPLPPPVRAQLREGGWTDGIWHRDERELESLQNLPVVLDGWDLFDQLFAWEQRPLVADGERFCASYLGAAVRSFFARGGRRAIVIRVGDPWPFLESTAQRAARRRVRLRRLLPDFAVGGASSFAPHDPAAWQGIHHLVGLPEVRLLVLPDLADACTFEPLQPRTAVPAPPLPEGFVECSHDEPVDPDRSVQQLPAPRLDSRGYAAWRLAVSAARAFLARHQREVMLLAALPLPHVDTQRPRRAGPVHAQADIAAYLQRIGVLREPGPGDTGDATSSAFVQLAWPWLRTRASSDLPEGLEPPDGALAGLIATGATLRGSFRSVAGAFSTPRLRDLAGAEPVPECALADDSAGARLARRVCVFAPSPEGWMLHSDVTTSPHEAWRFGGASRLIGSILRAARATGESVAFDANGPALWTRLRSSIEDLLGGFWLEGAFAGSTAAQAFGVRCDRSTMTQADLDAGRLVVEIDVRPAASIERITVVLNLGNSATAGALREVV